MKIREISPSDPISQLALDGLIQSAKALEDIEFYARGGNADSVKEAGKGNTTTIFRPINTDNTSTPPTRKDLPVAKKIVSFDASVDVVYEDRNMDAVAELAQETFNQAKTSGFILQEKIFEGNSALENAENEFDGLRKLTPAANKIPIAENGHIVVLGNTDAAVKSQQLSKELLLQSLARVRGGATVVYMNDFLKIRFMSVAKALGYYRLSKDEFGNEIEMIGNTIVRGAGDKEDGTKLLPFNETVGTSADCSSIFAVRYGTRQELSALTSVGVKGRFSGQKGNLITNNINFDMAFVLQNPAALYQFTGWRM